MLTDPYIQQLVHIKKRVRKKEVLDMSSTFTKRYPRNVMEKIKAHSPDTMLPKDIKMWFKEHDIEVVGKRKGNKKYDAVLTGDFLENTCEFFQRWEQIHNCVKQDGFIVTDLPFSVNSGWFSYQPNLFKQLAKQNNYDIIYFKMMDHAGQFPVTFEHTMRVTDTSLRNKLYKYQDTAFMRINVTFKKTTNEPFSFKDPQ